MEMRHSHTPNQYISLSACSDWDVFGEVGIGCVEYCYQASVGAGWRLWVPITLAGEKILQFRIEKSSVMGKVGHLQPWIIPNPLALFWKFYSI